MPQSNVVRQLPFVRSLATHVVHFITPDSVLHKREEHPGTWQRCQKCTDKEDDVASVYNSPTLPALIIANTVLGAALIAIGVGAFYFVSSR